MTAEIKSLTPPERETVVNGCDADDYIEVWTAQRKIITKLRKNPSARIIGWGRHGTTVWASFRLPARALSFRTIGEVELTAHEKGLLESLEVETTRSDPAAILAYNTRRGQDQS